MPIRITGMNSGLDTDTIISELMKAQSTKKDNLVKAQKTLQYKQDAWKTLNTKIYTFFNKTLGNMKFQSDYNKKTTKVTDSSIATITAGDGAVLGSQTLAVKQLAKSGYLTGAKLSDTKQYTEKTTLKDLGAVAEGETAKISLTTGGKTSTIELTSDMKISDVVVKMKEAGVNANFDASNQRFFISAKDSGVENDFVLTADNATGLTALKSMGIITKEDVLSNPDYQKWASFYDPNDAKILENLYAVGADNPITQDMDRITKLLESQNTSLTDKNKTLSEQVEKATKNLTTLKESEEYKKVAEKVGITDDMTMADAAKKVDDSIKVITDKQKRLTELEGKAEADLTDDEKLELEQLKAESTSWNDSLKELKEQKSVLDKAKGYETTIDSTTKEIAANESTIAANEARLNEADKASIKAEAEANLLAKVKVANEAVSNADSIVTGANSAIRVQGQDAIISLNGAEFTSHSNTISVNGLSITAQSLSEKTETGKDAEGNPIYSYKETEITTSVDVEGIYKQVKNFISEYSSLMNEMAKLYNADSAKGYEPLTDEEKKELSEDEIEKWEQKIKDASLRKDSTVNSVSEAMKSIMMEGVEVDGKKMYLSDFGINMLGYFDAPDNERNAYHIAGDPDDSATSSLDDKLRSMISSDPDTVSEFFSKLSTKLYDKLNQLMASSNLSSIYTAYNDKQMKDEYNKYTTKIAEQEKKLQALEEKYYQKFGAMETALAKLNSNQSAISGLLG